MVALDAHDPGGKARIEFNSSPTTATLQG